MKKIVVVTPHPDDETLGCGGTLLKYRDLGYEIYWLIITKVSNDYCKDIYEKRKFEINLVADKYDFKRVLQLELDTAKLDVVPTGDLISKISQAFKEIEPNVIFVPYPSDIHSDHKIVFEATMACTKWFRYPFVEKVLSYETLSETDFVINPDANSFNPNVFVNIESYLEEKIEIIKIYESEINEFPFPRSELAIKSLAYVRGAASGFKAAEAFMLLKERLL